MDKREFVIILSDIHMGINEPTVWYCKEVHEKYLIAILDDMIACADQIQEVILLGDIFEFWSYHPNRLPPSFDEIIEANPNILGPNGKFRQVLSALEGRLLYIPGDHDMNLSQTDLDKIKSVDGYTMKYHFGAYIPLYDNSILFTHGHELTLLNGSYFESKFAPFPIGYFVSRAIAYEAQNIFDKRTTLKSNKSEEYGTYELTDFLLELPYFLVNHENGSDFVSGLIDAIAYATGIPKELPIQINKTTAVSLNDTKKIYKYLIYDFYMTLKKQGLYSPSMPCHDLIEDINGTYLSWGINNTIGSPIHTVVMGYEHSTVLTSNDSNIDYINTGFRCASLSNIHSKPITYGIYHISNQSFQIFKMTDTIPINIHKVINDKNNLTIKHAQDIKKQIEIKEAIEDITTQFTFGFSVFDASLEFWKIMQMGVLSKAEELGIKVITHDQKSNAEEMVIGSINLINEGIDALLIAPFNPEELPFIVASASKKNIPVVAIDIGTGGADVVAFIVSDSFGGGIYAGEYALILIKKYNLKSKNVAIIKVQETAKYALLRGQGFKSVMEEAGYQVVAEVTANSEESQAYEAMKNILASYENDLAVVFCENGTMTLGAAKAIDEAGKKGEIMLIGFDSGPSIIEGIKNGSIQGTIAQEPFLMGQISVEVANSTLLGIPVSFDDSSQKLILMEVYLIDENGEAMRSIV